MSSVRLLAAGLLITAAIIPSITHSAYSHGVSGTGIGAAPPAGSDPFARCPMDCSPDPPYTWMAAFFIAAFCFGIFVLWKNRETRIAARHS